MKDDEEQAVRMKEWFDWYTSPPIDYRKVYGDAFVWTEQEKQLMLLQKLKEQK